VTDAERDPQAVMVECAEHLALMATRSLYREQPELWRLGEHGRRHTLADFGHHFRALAGLSAEQFRAHVEYCLSLWDARGFPRTWLDDAWRHMATVLERELPPMLARRARAVLEEGVAPPR
jgi:hypothetical protein